MTLETEVTALRATLASLPPAEAARLTSIWGSLTVKRRRRLLAYLQTGNASEAARRTYNVTTPNNAAQVGKEEDPKISYCAQALLEAEGVSPAKLRAIHAHHPAGFDSPEPGDRDRSLRATALDYKYIGPSHRARAGNAASTSGDIFDGWTSVELAAFAEGKIVPRRFASRFIANRAHPEPLTIPPSLDAEPDAPAAASAPSPAAWRGQASSSSLEPRPAMRAAEDARHELDRLERQLRDAHAPVLDPALRERAIRDRKW